ncbi:MAG TPA: menaquinone biosynthesis decarboxylase [Fimbriimonadaceae bacterium]|nr:menaquinone biosynthesis decarboxylase [Fimbriimonadaceae bacterium]
MAYRDFQHFLEVLESKGELKRIKEPVSPTLEITEIADRVMKSGGPALLFENVAGSPHRLGTPDPMSAVMGHPGLDRQSSNPSILQSFPYPVAINTMGSRRRMSLALSCDDFEEHAARIAALLKPELPKGKIETLKKLPWLLGELKGVPPKEVGGGVSQEIVMEGDDVDLTKLPILTCWPEDGGPFVTLPLVFTHDPTTGKRNVGMYRVQLYDRNTCGMHWQMHKTGMRHMEDSRIGGLGRSEAQSSNPQSSNPSPRMHVAVALGGDPAITFSAISPLPPGIDEMLFAGFLRRENVRLTKAKTVDLMVPADAEIVIEGYIDPSELRLEGPFGDHTGYYSLAEPFPVLHVTAVTQRKNAVYPATIVGIPPMEDGWMGKAVERIFLPLIQLSVPEIVDMSLPVEACFHNVAFVSIKKKYPGHAYKVMNAIWGLGGLAFTKFVFVFDADCNVQDFGEVLFRIGANCDPGRDTLMSKGPVDQLDHAAQEMGFGGKIGFDCTHKLPGENGFSRDYPKLIRMSEDVKAKIDALWPKLGL